MHWPKISKLKQKEMETLKGAFDVKRSLNRSTQSQIIKKRIPGNRSGSRNLMRKNEYVSTSEPTFSGLQNIKRDSNSGYTILDLPKRRWKENKMIPKPEIKKEPKIIDYLLERRQKRQLLEEEHPNKSGYRYRSPYNDLTNPPSGRGSRSKQKFFNSRSLDNYGLHEKSTIDPLQEKYSKIERLGKIREQARVIEETIQRKEQLLKLQGGSVSENAGVNDMLIDAITAKLRVLDDL